MIFWRKADMNSGNLSKVALSALLGLAMQPAWAQDAPSAESPSEREAQEAYEQALLAAEQEKEAAMVAVEKARRELERAAEVRAGVSLEEAEAMEAAQDAGREAERAYREASEAMRRELSAVQEELRRASREVVRAHRDLERLHRKAPSVTTVRMGSKAVIGVVLGDSNDAGVQILGVSPDGPSERAGIEQGDIIVSVMGEELAGSDDADAGKVLLEVMQGVKPGDELDITVLRDGSEQSCNVTAEAREPIGWTSRIRLPSAPMAPGESITSEEIIEVPEIDRTALAEKMQRLQEDLERKRIVISRSGEHEVHVSPEGWEFNYETLSDIGEEALYSANVWLGMPMTRGLELAEVDENLGDYFKADHGVLVLKAAKDNELQLMSGDVVLTVAGNRVDKPADLMRELRELESGATLELEIMRKRKSKTIEVVLPERVKEFGFVPEVKNEFLFRYPLESN